MPPRTVVRDDQVFVGARFAVTFQRTLRVPDDGGAYPLPPGLGRLPVRRMRACGARAPRAWRAEGGVIVPLYQREALWLGFHAAAWKPNAVQVAVGGVNAVTGGPWQESLAADPQNYIVCPEQLWLDGINVAGGFVRQFVAMPLGAGYTVEEQVTGRAAVGGMQLRVYEPRPGRFPDRPPRARPATLSAAAVIRPMAAPALGLAAGGRIQQKIYPDRYGVDTWDPAACTSLFVHLVNSEQYEALTGEPPPPSPISAATYTEHGLPWFVLYDEDRGALPGSPTLAKVKSIGEQDAEAGRGADPADAPLTIDPSQVRRLRPPPAEPSPPEGDQPG
ncbi:MAG TPA: hypothetical protein VII06_27375 [Chloroflexota bacterium]|jgi:hypothetical protein